MNIFWFRRDLRIDDNAGFFHALQSDENVLPIFIFDEEILSQLPKDDHRVSFICELLATLQYELQKRERSLAVFHGKPLDIFQKLISENKVKSIYTNNDYEPYARKRDKELNTLFITHNIDFKTCKDQVIFEKSEVNKEDGKPYVVYTPYAQKWKENFKKIKLVNYNSEDFLDQISTHSYPFLSLPGIGFEVSPLKIASFSTSPKLIDDYEATRNFPSILGTSLVGPYLRFGAVSIRKIVREAIQSKSETFLKELIWREFFMQILWHFPHTIHKSFREKYDAIAWDNNEELFQKWCDGKTGYPFVDAGMRELNATGHMHNRVRMIVASFLCKHLLIDWRWGETYFAQKLFDYEQSSNVGNWQWAAGSGVDAAPYFRIFNPESQLQKFDKELKYVKKWIPELKTADYPKPIVDHKEAREKCLKAYKDALSN